MCNNVAVPMQTLGLAATIQTGYNCGKSLMRRVECYCKSLVYFFFLNSKFSLKNCEVGRWLLLFLNHFAIVSQIIGTCLFVQVEQMIMN